tara:strand:+ start:1553 stop:2317 length:765 start_codon:yes stop_codon:yes gene_type:complete
LEVNLKNRLEGKTVIITGGNTGIGKAVCTALGREGSNVVIGWYEHESQARSLADTINNIDMAAAIPVFVDVTNEKSVEVFVGSAFEKFGSVDVLINNAGIQKSQSIDVTSMQDWDIMMNVHLRGAFLCSRAVVPHMIKRRAGCIINVCSQLGYIGRENYTAYSAAKGGLIAFTRALARELGPSGIRVNGVSPGLVDTGFDPLPEHVKDQHAASLPMTRLAHPDDVTSAFIFLASEEGRYYCGQMLHPNGGEIMP